MTDLLDRAEDPARMIRMIILEMEETLVEVRATAARSIADIKEMRRSVSRLDELQSEGRLPADIDRKYFRKLMKKYDIEAAGVDDDDES